jgi:hypothetical protein
MPCSTILSLASNTKSSAYFTVLIIYASILRSLYPSRASMVRHSLYKLNTICDKQHTCLTPLPVFTLLFSPRLSRTLTLWAMYKLLINLLSRQSISVPFSICINLVQLTRSNAFCQSMKQTHTSASISRVHSDFILSILIASTVPFSILNPNWSSRSTYSLFLSILILSIFATIFAVCAIRRCDGRYIL